MFRIAVHHQDPDHPNAAPFAWRRPFDDQEEAEAALESAALDYSPEDGYSLTVERLVHNDDGSGSWVALAPADESQEASD